MMLEDRGDGRAGPIINLGFAAGNSKTVDLARRGRVRAVPVVETTSAPANNASAMTSQADSDTMMKLWTERAELSLNLLQLFYSLANEPHL